MISRVLETMPLFTENFRPKGCPIAVIGVAFAERFAGAQPHFGQVFHVVRTFEKSQVVFLVGVTDARQLFAKFSAFDHHGPLPSTTW